MKRTMNTGNETMSLLLDLAANPGKPECSARLLTLYNKMDRERRGPPLVYVAGPYTATTRDEVECNIMAAELVGIMIAQLGGMPVIPHCNTSAPAFERVQPYEFWIAGTMALMYRCDAVVMVPGWRESKGATCERAEAMRIGMPVIGDESPGVVASDCRMIAGIRELIERLR